MALKFALVGGDRRAARLAVLLRQDAHRVCTYALERAELPAEIPKAGCLQGCVYGADCIVLPTPAEAGGFLNAPLSGEKLRAEELVGALWQGQRLIGGRLGDALCLAALRQGLVVDDLLRRPDFAALNAALTAESAIGELMANSERSLWRSRVLVCGWGRIARLLTPRLLGLGKNLDMVKLLHQYGAKLGQQDKQNNSPLHVAAMMPDGLPYVQFLLKNGAMKNVRNNRKQTPFMVARDPKAKQLLKVK